MKKILSILSLLWVLIISGCWWSVDVVEYNDTLVAIVKECTDANQELFQKFEMDKSSIDSIVESLQNNIDICQSLQEKASKLWDYQKDSSLKDWVVDLLEMEVDYLQKFWLTERYRNLDNITDEDKVAYDSIVTSLNEAQNALNQQFINLQEIQEAFAAKYKLKLQY